MSKSPEEYFQDQSFAPANQPGTCFSEAELAFMRKYMGLDPSEALSQIGFESPAVAPLKVVEHSSVLPVEAERTQGKEDGPLAVDAPVHEADAPASAAQELEPGDAEMLAMAAEFDGAGLEPEKTDQPALAESDTLEAVAEPLAGVAVSASPSEESTAAAVEAAPAQDAPSVRSARSESEELVAQAETAPSIPAAEAKLPAPGLPPAKPQRVKLPPPDLYSEMAEEEPLDLILRREEQVQMVGFFLGKQEFTVPTLAVQEVIRYETPAKMPAAPAFVAGVINLRGKMTPLVHLRDMLEIRQPRETEDRFIIVCRRKGLQVGLIIERVHTMYRVPQSDIDWGIEGLLGINNAEFISGLLKLNESLVGVVSVDRLVDYILD